VLLLIVVAGVVVFAAVDIDDIHLVTPMLRRFITALAFTLVTTICGITLFGNRVYHLLIGSKVSRSFRVQSKVSPTEEGTDEAKQLSLISKAALKARTNEVAKMELCAQQIEMWYAFLSVLSAAQGEDIGNADALDIVATNLGKVTNSQKRLAAKDSNQHRVITTHKLIGNVRKMIIKLPFSIASRSKAESENSKRRVKADEDDDAIVHRQALVVDQSVGGIDSKSLVKPYEVMEQEEALTMYRQPARVDQPVGIYKADIEKGMMTRPV
jgi:hypothetical protein